jgi:hypothetical protein
MSEICITGYTVIFLDASFGFCKAAAFSMHSEKIILRINIGIQDGM